MSGARVSGGVSVRCHVSRGECAQLRQAEILACFARQKESAIAAALLRPRRRFHGAKRVEMVINSSCTASSVVNEGAAKEGSALQIGRLCNGAQEGDYMKIGRRRCLGGCQMGGVADDQVFSRQTGRRPGHRLVVTATAAESNPREGVSVYKPASYDILIADAARSVEYALADGVDRMEVEFPPLPSTISGYKGASDDFIDANIQLAVALARKLNQAKGLNTRLIFPDRPERRRASRTFRSTLDLATGLSFGSLDDIPGGTTQNIFSRIKNVLDFDFNGDVEEEENGSSSASAFSSDLFIVVNCSTVELPAIEKFMESQAAKNIPIILFNLELDTLRADLGLFGFPPKDLHYRFLSSMKPVFYLRKRDYSKSVSVAPFILNYSGALFRQYPGPWQVMLKQNDSSYACVAEDDERFTLGETKEELLAAVGLNTEEQGSTMAFLRRGYKTSTWWEENIESEDSSAWRT